MQLTSGPLRLVDCWRLAAVPLNREAAAGLMPGPRWATFRRLLLLRSLGPSATICVRSGRGSVPIACGGIAEQLPGVGEAWAVISHRVTEAGLGFRLVRAAQRCCGGWIRSGRFHRVHAFVPAGDDRFVAWVHALGLEFETLLHAACADGSNVLVFAQIINRKSEIADPRPKGGA